MSLRPCRPIKTSDKCRLGEICDDTTTLTLSIDEPEEPEILTVHYEIEGCFRNTREEFLNQISQRAKIEETTGDTKAHATKLDENDLEDIRKVVLRAALRSKLFETCDDVKLKEEC